MSEFLSFNTVCIINDKTNQSTKNNDSDMDLR